MRAKLHLLTVGAFEGHMNKHRDGRSIEIDYVDWRWMVQLGKLSRSATRIVLKNYQPSVASTAFVSRVSAEANFEVVAWEQDLILAKIQ